MILTELFDAPHQKGMMFSACLRLNAKPLHISRTLTQIGLIGMAVLMTACGNNSSSSNSTTNASLVAEGKQTFRFDTFGDETKWTDALRMDAVVSTVDPTSLWRSA